MSSAPPNLAASRDMRVKIKDDNDVFINFAGLQTKALRLSAKTVDVSNSQSAGQWRELLPGARLKSASISGEGVFTDAASSLLARSIFFAQDVRDYQFILPEFGTVEGPFLISELSYSGLHGGAAQFELLLLSAGEPSFTPAS